MKFSIYLTYFGVSLIGMALSALVIAYSLNDKAKQNNLQFPTKAFWGIDLLIKTLGALLTTMLFLSFLPAFLKKYPDTDDLILRVFFSLSGYFGSDLASRFFSTANSRLNAASGYKAKGFDEANGTTDAPTPAAKPVKP